MQRQDVDLGARLIPYREGWDLQRRVHAEVVAGTAPSTLLLMEHQDVYTVGRRARSWERPSGDVVDPGGVPVVAVDRGGKTTWHGPGLSSSQQEQLRQVRAEYRQRLDNLLAQSRILRQYTTRESNLVLSGPVFDDNMARHYVNEKYATQMQREVENLRAQHALLQILTPQQRQEWMRQCMHMYTSN